MQCGKTWFWSLGWEDPLEKEMATHSRILGASLVAQMVKNLPAIQKTWVWPLGWEDPLEKGMATHSSILAWRNPWTEEPGRLQSMGSQRVKHEQMKGADDVLKWVKIPALVLNVETWWIIPAFWSVFPFVKQIERCTAECYKLLWGQLLP